MKITVKQLRRIIKEEVQKVVKESTRDPHNLVGDLEDMAIGSSFYINIHTMSGVMGATISKAAGVGRGMGPDGEEVELDATYVFSPGEELEELGGEEKRFDHPTELTGHLDDKGWEFSY